MEMYHCEERIYVLPENAICKADEYKRNPLDIDNCPLGHEICTGDCYQYEEGRKLSTRNKYLKDYGISYEDGRKIVDYCRKAKGYDQQLILQAAQEVYPEIAPYLFLNLTTGLGYDRMGNIPMQRKDFQGYRRKTMETYNRYMILNGKRIV